MDISVKSIDEFELKLDEKSDSNGDLIIHLTTDSEDHVSVFLPLVETSMLAAALAMIAQTRLSHAKVKLN